MMADPRIVNNPKPIDVITYRELRELAYMGAGVLHEEAIFPVRFAGIPINIRNTNDPTAAGTMIVPDAPVGDRIVTGIAGKKGFSVITVDKELMNTEIGFGRRLLSVLERENQSRASSQRHRHDVRSGRDTGASGTPRSHNGRNMRYAQPGFNPY